MKQSMNFPNVTNWQENNLNKRLTFTDKGERKYEEIKIQEVGDKSTSYS